MHDDLSDSDAKTSNQEFALFSAAVAEKLKEDTRNKEQTRDGSILATGSGRGHLVPPATAKQPAFEMDELVKQLQQLCQDHPDAVVSAAAAESWRNRKPEPPDKLVTHKVEGEVHWDVTAATNQTMVILEGGSFQMGSPDDETETPFENPCHPGNVDSFAVAATEVTNAEVHKFLEDRDFNANGKPGLSDRDEQAWPSAFVVTHKFRLEIAVSCEEQRFRRACPQSRGLSQPLGASPRFNTSDSLGKPGLALGC